MNFPDDPRAMKVLLEIIAWYAERGRIQLEAKPLAVSAPSSWIHVMSFPYASLFWFHDVSWTSVSGIVALAWPNRHYVTSFVLYSSQRGVLELAEFFEEVERCL